MLEKKITFIGPGVMAEAMIAGLLRKELSKPGNITASGPREKRGEKLKKKYGINTTTDNTNTTNTQRKNIQRIQTYKHTKKIIRKTENKQYLQMYTI